jgi:hypothetical protein
MGIAYKDSEYDFDCDICHQSKAKQQISYEHHPIVHMPLHQIHTDTIHHSTLGVHSFRYSTHLLDTCSGYHWILFATTMADIAKKIVQ